MGFSSSLHGKSRGGIFNLKTSTVGVTGGRRACPEKEKCIIGLLLFFQVLVAKSELFIVAHFISCLILEGSPFPKFMLSLSYECVTWYI